MAAGGLNLKLIKEDYCTCLIRQRRSNKGKFCTECGKSFRPVKEIWETSDVIGAYRDEEPIYQNIFEPDNSPRQGLDIQGSKTEVNLEDKGLSQIPIRRNWGLEAQTGGEIQTRQNYINRRRTHSEGSISDINLLLTPLRRVNLRNTVGLNNSDGSFLNSSQESIGSNISSGSEPENRQNGNHVMNGIRAPRVYGNVAPPSFSGLKRECPESFFRKFARYADKLEIPEGERVEHIGILLDKSALEYYETILEDAEEQENVVTVEDLKQKITEHFTTPESKMVLWSSLHNRKLQTDENIREYYEELRKKNAKLQGSRDQLLSFFINGLPKQMRAHVIFQKVGNVEEAIRCAIEYELITQDGLDNASEFAKVQRSKRVPVAAAKPEPQTGENKEYLKNQLAEIRNEMERMKLKETQEKRDNLSGQQAGNMGQFTGAGTQNVGYTQYQIPGQFQSLQQQCQPQQNQQYQLQQNHLSNQFHQNQTPNLQYQQFNQGFQPYMTDQVQGLHPMQTYFNHNQGTGFNQNTGYMTGQMPFSSFNPRYNNTGSIWNNGRKGNAGQGSKTCYYCQKSGHYKKDCFKKQKDEKEKQNQRTTVGNMVEPGAETQTQSNTINSVNVAGVKSMGDMTLRIGIGENSYRGLCDTGSCINIMKYSLLNEEEMQNIKRSKYESVISVSGAQSAVVGEIEKTVQMGTFQGKTVPNFKRSTFSSNFGPGLYAEIRRINRYKK